MVRLKLSILICLFILILLFSFGCQLSSNTKTSRNKTSKKTVVTSKKFSDYESEADRSYNATSNKENYIKDCRYEITHNIIFPLQSPSYAIVHFNDDSVKKPKLITSAQLRSLLNVLNDTSTYAWGEIGTPYFDKYITFYNQSGKCIAITNISYDGQISSTPTTAKMKNGRLTGQGENSIKAILERK